jgi:uncharacterized membrane protein
MTMKSNKIAHAVMAGIVGSALVAGTATQAVAAAKKDAEKCYGIAKKGKNDCAMSKHSCQGHATKNGQGKEWLYVLKGTCEKIVCGSTKPYSGVCPELKSGKKNKKKS